MKKLNKKNTKNVNVVNSYCCTCTCSDKMNRPLNSNLSNVSDYSKSKK